MKSIQRKTAFSLIELIATVIVITLALGILIPTLQAGKQYSKSDICLSNLKELSVATRIYTEDNNGQLPGALHPAVYHHQTVEGYKLYGLPSGSSVEFHLQRQLSYRLRPIMGDDVDRAITCPTIAGIASERHFREFKYQTGRSVFPAHYALNNWGDRNPESLEWTYSARPTKPQCYFGYQPPIGSTDSTIQPQRICNIKQPAKEWMMADAWYRSAATYIREFQQEGSYQSNWSGEALPYFAPHFKRGSTKMYTDRGDRTSAAYRVRRTQSDGLTSTLFFDGHAAAVPSRTFVCRSFELLYGFPGTVNPKLSNETSQMVWDEGTWE